MTTPPTSVAALTALTTLTTPAAPATPAGVRRLTVLYDARCTLCRGARGWLERQPQLVELEFVPTASQHARERYPFLDADRTLEELTVVGDGGEIWVGAKAWVVCLWALQGKRGLAHRLSSPAMLPQARAVVAFVSRHRRTSGTVGERCECAPG